MERNLINEVREKREFSGLSDSIVRRALRVCDNDVKDSRALLRKYFGVFLTNRVFKKKGDLLKIHMSSRKRDYGNFYFKIFKVVKNVRSVVDLGCGVNGFSYGYLKEIVGDVDYIGVEAVKQLVNLSNEYFKINGFSGKVVCLDLFDLGCVRDILKEARMPRVVFMFQVVDALEGLERNFSKKFILEIMEESEWVVLSLSIESIGGRKKFLVDRKWMLDFLEDNFSIERDFVFGGERIIILKK